MKDVHRIYPNKDVMSLQHLCVRTQQMQKEDIKSLYATTDYSAMNQEDFDGAAGLTSKQVQVAQCTV